MATGLGRRPGHRPANGAVPGGDGRDDGRGDGDDDDCPAPDGTPAGTAAPRLVHEPALDGLRGLAVLAVLVFHLDRVRGGFLGVDLFFALSGFLITSLLLVEYDTRGAIDLRAFWARRARRLLPALFVLLAGVAVLLATLTAAADRPRFRGDALATLGYAANWHRMAAEASYWDIFSHRSPLDHTWSLAIEEQFYLLWPLVALLVLGGWRLRRRGRGAGGGRAFGDEPTVGVEPEGSAAPGTAARAGRRLGLLALAGGAVSLAELGLLWSPADTNRAYFGTDSRLGPTLLGAALATVTARRGRRSGPPAPAWDVAATLALAGMAAAFLVIDGQGPAYYRGGLAAFTLAALVVIAAVTGGPPGRVARALSWRPLAALGAISYGVYLWHWPLIVYVTPERLGVRRVVAQAVAVAATLALAVVSYGLVERPVRHGALPRRTALPLATGAALAVLVAALVTTRGQSAAVADELVTVDGHRYNFDPEEVPPGAVRLLLVGDSGPIFLGDELADEAERSGGRFAVGLSTEMNCKPAVLGERERYPDGRVLERDVCPELRRERWEHRARELDADVVVYYVANAGTGGVQWFDGRWATDCDPEFDAAMAADIAADVEALAGTGATVILATSPQPMLATSPQPAFITPTSAEEVDCRNATYRRVAADHPGTQVIDLNTFLQELRLPEGGPGVFRDNVHLSDPAARRVAAWMLPAVEEVRRATEADSTSSTLVAPVTQVARP